MKLCLPSLWVAALCAAATIQGQPTTFTYQGRLTEGLQPAAGEYVFEFRLFESPTGGTAVGDPVGAGPALVTDGLFTVQLDFGARFFDPAARWLEISVRTNAADAEFTVLAPRQQLTASPLAVLADRATTADRAELADSAGMASTADRADTAELAEGVAAGSITAASVAPGSLLAANLALDQVVRSLNGRHDDLVLEGGTNTVVTPTAAGLAVHARAWGLEGNGGTDGATQFLGTTDAAPLELRVNNRRVMRYEESTNLVVSVLGGDADNVIRPGILGVTIAGGGTTFGGSADWLHRVDAAYSTVGGGMAHALGVNASSSTISGGFANRVDELADLAVIAGGGNNVIGVNAFRSTISGGYQNGIAPGAYFSTVGGGWTNQVGAFISTISGGTEHHIGSGASYSTIGGGSGHRIEGNARTGTIAGGGENRVQTGSIRSTIGGGKDNQVGSNSSHTVIGGGLGNRIGNGAEGAVIPGGISNRVDGAYGFAAGQHAQAVHPGAFVWADTPAGMPLPFASAAANEVALRATGGVRLVTGVDAEGQPANGVVLAPGSGSWASMSDRAAKTDFEPVDAGGILEEVARLPLQTWRYRTEPSGARHLGPVAQDFHAAFGLGANDRTIAAVDADGVALAAIQALYRLVQEQQGEIAALRLRLDALTQPE
jgi:trimeric autotransporter adhesin